MILRAFSIAIFIALTSTVQAEDINFVDIFAKLPRFADIRISPDGSKLLMLRPIGGTNHLAVMDLEKKKTKFILAADKEKFTFRWCRWANKKRILCSIVGDSGNNPFVFSAGFKATRLIAVNHDGSEVLTLNRRPKPREGYRLPSQFQDSILNILPDNPDEILIQVDRDKAFSPSVHRLNIYTNKLTRVQRHKSGIFRWYTDWKGNVRLGVGVRKDKPTAVTVDSDGSTKRLDVTGLSQDFPPAVYGITPDGSGAYVAGYAPGSDRTGLHIVDLETAKLRETLVDDPDYDFLGTLYRTNQDLPVAASWLQHEPEYKWFDDKWEALHKDVSKALPGTTIRLTGSNRDETKFILQTSSHNKVPHWYIYDNKARQLIAVAADYSLPEGMQLAPVKPVTYKARDGLDIPAYLTLPNKRNADKRLPTVIFPHGGPFARDAQVFNYWVQFMAAKGYAVLQPNFRGSTGYGNRFLTSGYREWGKAMQNDVIDGLDWLVAEGITDADKTCIVGGSYGGYVALTAAWQTPEKFKCAASFAGISDLPDMVRNMRNFRLGELTVDRIAESFRDFKDLNKLSAIEHIGEINIPLLIAHGDIDRRVPVRQSRDLVDELKDSKIDYQYIEQEGGDHHLSLEEHRIAFFSALGEFLDRHLK